MVVSRVRKFRWLRNLASRDFVARVVSSTDAPNTSRFLTRILPDALPGIGEELSDRSAPGQVPARSARPRPNPVSRALRARPAPRRPGQAKPQRPVAEGEGLPGVGTFQTQNDARRPVAHLRPPVRSNVALPIGNGKSVARPYPLAECRQSGGLRTIGVLARSGQSSYSHLSGRQSRKPPRAINRCGFPAWSGQGVRPAGGSACSPEVLEEIESEITRLRRRYAVFMREAAGRAGGGRQVGRRGGRPLLVRASRGRGRIRHRCGDHAARS